jgi:putative endonuclease
MSRHNIDLGKFGEMVAERHLVNQGATVLARNYRFEPGEIDLIVEHEEDLVAVEVKTRTELDLEMPEEAVTRWKLRRMALGLATFATENEMLDRHWRLDVVAVEIDLFGHVSRCEHIRDAFDG